MAKFAVTLKNGDVIEVLAPTEDAALAHAKAVADTHHIATQVGPKSVGGPMQDERPANPVRAMDEQPVSAVKVK